MTAIHRNLSIFFSSLCTCFTVRTCLGKERLEIRKKSCAYLCKPVSLIYISTHLETIPILRQQKDYHGVVGKRLILLTFITAFMLTYWVGGSEKVQKYADVI